LFVYLIQKTLKHNSADLKPIAHLNVHCTRKRIVKSVESSSCAPTVDANVGTCPQFHGEDRPEMQYTVYTSPIGKHDTAQPDTDVTLPLPTPMLALQIEQYRAQLSVFPHGHQGPRGQNMLEEMEQELLLR
jgi:hypothetical protein